MKKLKLYSVALMTVMSLTFLSCDEHEHKPKGKFESGTFVINEGNFLDADGTVSHISASGEVTNDLFGSINNSKALGDVVQSMSIDGDFAYVVVNNSNKIEVVNANTFESTHTISDLKLPRYFTTFAGKGYVTEWFSFSEPGRVSIIDLQNKTLTGTSIVTDYGAEHIVVAGGSLFVSNSFSNTVSVIDPSANQVTKTLTVGNSPGTFVTDSQNKLWIICGGGYDSNFNPLNDGKLVQIDPTNNSILKTIELGVNVSAKVAINKARNQLFYFKGKSVYRVNTTDTTAPGSALLTESAALSFYGIGIDPTTDVLFVADSKAFAGSGTVFTYSTTGSAVTNVSVGRGPNGFVFRN